MNSKFTRRDFLLAGLGATPGLLALGERQTIMTIQGEVSALALGTTLIHEHFLVDFIGADKTTTSRWDREKVTVKVLPFLQAARQAGVKSIFDCTPAFLGRDVTLLSMLARKSGIQIVTNTGYYGAVGNKYLPPWAFTETADQLATRWTKEFEGGIDGSAVKPGFIKISVDAGPLSELHQKLVRAAAATHLRTGLTICSHTGPAPAAFEQLEILDRQQVQSCAFVWVHAQSEKDKTTYVQVAKMGAWVSLDGLGWGNFDDYTHSLLLLREAGLLHRTLISHDAGWYKPDEPDAEFKGYTNIFTELLPRLEQQGFTRSDFEQLLVRNPAEAFALRVRRS